jgi:hypothetical protein
MRNTLGLVAFIILIGASATPVAASESVDPASDQEFAAYVLERAQAHDVSVDAYLDSLREQERLSWVVREVNTHPNDFGGVSWDWSAKIPGFVIQYVGDEPPRFDPDVTEVRVLRSRAELLSILEDLDRNLANLDARASGLVSIAIDDVANAVVLVTAAPNFQVSNIVAPYGDAVALQYGSSSGRAAACINRQNCTPFRGGIEIDGNVWACTYGLNARYSLGKAVVTSGHCDVQNDDYWRHNGNPVGPSTRNGLHGGQDVDALRIFTTTATSPYNRVYSTSGQMSVPIVGALGDDDIFFGMDIRRVGINTSINCEVTGYVNFKYWFVKEGGIWAAWGRATNCTAVEGDSGGPIWHTDSQSNRFLVGITSLTDGTFAVQDDVLRTLDLIEWCTNTSCV